MCTAACYKTKDFYFGRTLDYEFSYGDRVVITPRNFPFFLRHGGVLEKHFAMIGMACVIDGYPLYYDAVNEAGLCCAGLNFVGNAVYEKPAQGRRNLAQFELIPFLLGSCKSVAEAKGMLREICLTDTPFSEKLPTAQLHWLIADAEQCITLECTADGMHIYENPVGILTNNPPLPQQLFALNNYMHLSAAAPQNTFSETLALVPYSRGMGALGLPGDLSSMSRFVRAAFVRLNSVSEETEEKSVSQFFHILGSVDQQRGCCKLENGQYEITLYTSCCNASRGIYYYTTYDNHCISAVDMNRENLDAGTLLSYAPIIAEQIFYQN